MSKECIENKNALDRNILSVKDEYAYCFAYATLIRGATLIHRNDPMRLAGYQHIPGN